MSSEHDIAIISVGYRNSPFTEEILKTDIIPYSIIANNSSDFQIHHADPSKILFYSLEFTKIIETIAKKSMDSLAVFETLGQFFEFYNPLHLSTLNYLISKYATSIKPENKEYMQAWKNISETIFEQEFIYPLFQESRIFHIKEGDVEIPVRKFLMSSEIEKKKDNSKNNTKALSQVLEEITGVIDLEEANKMKLCTIAVKKITSASAVIIIPTDIVSLFILFSSNHFKETLQKSNGEIAIISPFWPGNEINQIEKTILQKTDFEADLANFAKLVKDCVDAIIIDTKDSDLVPILREEGITVLVEDLTSENQSTQKFLETVLKSIEVSLDSIVIEPQGLIEGLGEKLVSLFRVREPKQEKEAKDESVVQTLEISVSEEDKELIESIFDEDIQIDEPKVETEITEIQKEQETLTDEFEMEVIDTEEAIQSIPAPPPKNGVTGGEYYVPKADGQFVLPGIEQITQFELEELDSLDVDEHIITSFIERAMTSNATGVEVVFSDLLSLQNNPLLIDKIYHTILKRLIKVRELSPEEKIADMITYLSAHKPDYYHEKLNDLLEETLNSEDDRLYNQNLKTASLVVRSSLLIAGDTIENFLKKNINTADIYIEDRLKRMINTFGLSMHLLSRVLIKIYQQELETEKPKEIVLQRIVSFLTMFDGLSVSMTLVTLGSDSLIESISNAINEMVLNNSFKGIITDVLTVFNEGTYEDLVKAFQGRKLPENLEFEMMKRKYISSLSKVGSIPLDLFAEKVGLSVDKAEKMIYDMILKEEIPARIELASGRLYIVQDHAEVEIVADEKPETVQEISEEIEIPENEVEVPDKPEKEETVEILEEQPEQIEVEETPVEEFVCAQCQRSFKTERGLKMHVSKTHKES